MLVATLASCAREKGQPNAAPPTQNRAGEATNETESEGDPTMPPQIVETENLDDYLSEMGERLNCFFTFEDDLDPDGAQPWIAYIEVTPDYDIETIEALVDALNEMEDLEGITIVRSETFPSVIHLKADILLQEGYVMDETVDVEYAGRIGLLPDHLGTLLEGRIRERKGIAIGEFTDVGTEIDLDVQDMTVRDVLTAAVPFDEYNYLLWEARREYWAEGEPIGVMYFGPRGEPEENGEEEEPEE
jgi:hypothetical protein